jgi:hypothetical protein
VRPQGRTRDDAGRYAAVLHHRQVRGIEMLERRRRLLLDLRQRDPALDAVHSLAVAALEIRRALGMGDAAPRRHQVHLAGHDRERIALAVAVHDLAVEQIGHRRKPDMGMRTHIDAVSGDELHRAHLVEEDERSDHLALAVRQRAPHLEAAEVAHPRHDRELQRIAGALVAEHGVFVGHPAHGGPPFAWLRDFVRSHMAVSPANGKTWLAPGCNSWCDRAVGSGDAPAPLERHRRA